MIWICESIAESTAVIQMNSLTLVNASSIKFYMYVIMFIVSTFATSNTYFENSLYLKLIIKIS